MTLEEKQDTLRDLGAAIAKAKRHFDDGSTTFFVNVSAWTIWHNRSGNPAAKPQRKHGRGDLCHED